MQKGVSNTDLKKNAPPDDDFGRDFFDSWKSAKLGNDSMDFDMETVPKNKKASFKFDEFDNFELSGNFDKLSSFKLDVPDLDFPGLSNKNEKTHEKSSKEIATGKKELKEDKFSFDFDFNSFDLESKSPEDKRDLSENEVPELSSKHGTNQESSDNISTSNNISKEVSIGKRAAIADGNEKRTSVTMPQIDHSHGKYLPRGITGNHQDFCPQTSSDDGSAGVALLGIQTDNTPLDVIKPKTQMERPDPMQPISSSPSGSSSPVDSYNSGYLTKLSGKELPNPCSELQKHQSQDLLTRISGSLINSFQIRKGVHNPTGPKKSIEVVKNIDEKQNACQNLKPPLKQNMPQNLMRPPLKREFTFGGSTKLRGLMNTNLQLNTKSVLEDIIPQRSPKFISNLFNPLMEARTKSTYTSTSNDRSFQIKPSSATHQTSIDAKSTAGSNLQKLSTDATVDPKVSSVGYNMTSVKEKSKPKLDSSRTLGSQIIHINNDASLADNDHRGILKSAIAKTIEVNNNKTNYSKPRETKSVNFLEKRMVCPVNAVNQANIEKHVSLHAPLKRKIDEESVTDLETSTPLKCVKESTANRRSSFEASQNSKQKRVPDFKITETCKDVMPVVNLTSLTVGTEIDNPVAEVSSNLEYEDNLLKTETLNKALDSICRMLTKKHEEAKELQVRSIINNNALLFLNYSMLDENIQELQKFSTSLLMET